MLSERNQHFRFLTRTYLIYSVLQFEPSHLDEFIHLLVCSPLAILSGLLVVFEENKVAVNEINQNVKE